MNIINYIENHKDEDFYTFKFTEIDNLILALIPYLDLTGIIPYKKKLTLKEVAEKLDLTKKNLGFFMNNTYKMFKIMSSTSRYSSILLYNYQRINTEEMQFGAISMKLPDKSIYIAFAGTDTSIIGWEENFKMAYLYPGISQKYAGTYLNKTIGIFAKNVYIGGHSKGGNLAISAAMMVKPYHKWKIKAIYNNDGPGFLKEQIETKEYQKIVKKIKMFVPEESIIGMILYHTPDYIVVKAKGFNIFEHDAFNWGCDNTKFIRAKQNKRSKELGQRLAIKLDRLPPNKKIKLINDLFVIFKNNNIKDAKEIRINHIFKLIKSFTNLSKETQNLLIELIIIIFIK